MIGEVKLIVPEIIVFDTIKTLLTFVKNDFNINVSTPTKSFLYRLLNSSSQIQLQRYNLYEQAVQIFVSKEDNPRKLDVNIFFNSDRASIPTIHIVSPNENSGINGINIDEGFQTEVYDEITTKFRSVYSRRFDSQTQIIITSDNTNEVIAIYHVLRALLIPTINHLNMAGLEEITYSGGDISIDQSIVSQRIFAKAIGFKYSYDVNVQDFYDQQYINTLEFEGTILQP